MTDENSHCNECAVHPQGSGENGADVGRHRRTVFDVMGLCCQSEVDLIEDALSNVDGIDDHAINIPAGTLTVYHDGDDERNDEIADRLQKAGLKATARRAVARKATVDEGPYSAHFWVIVAGVVLASIGGVFEFALEMAEVATGFFVASIAVGGFFVFKRAWAGVKRRQFNIPILMTIAVIGASLIGEWIEAVAVIVLFAFAEWLESRSMARARREIGELMRLAPREAERIEGDGQTRTVPLEEIEVGDRLRVRPGAKIPIDGVVEKGRTEIDQSTITGESVPVLKKAGDEVYSGTVNTSGAVVVRATQPASRSTLAHIIDAIEDARENQSSTEQFIDRFAQVYTPAVVAAAGLVAVIPPAFFGAGWMDWFYRALVFLVIACPCALVISTPIANVAGLARTAREGVLVKGGKFLELLGRLQAVAFDKTGTLTGGRPRVEQIEVFGKWSEEAVLLTAARCEADSEHHLGRAIVDEARHRWSPGEFVDRARDVTSAPGRGIEAVIDAEGLDAMSDRSLCRVGTPRWLESTGIVVDEATRGRFDEMNKGGRTVVAVGIDGELAGLIALRDKLRPEAPAALDELRRSGISSLYLITGDHRETAASIGAELELDEDAIAAELLPDQKVTHIENLRRQHDGVAMVGDGVNDAPALAASSVGVAMGAAGTDVALESADVALMGDELRRIPRAVEIGRKTTRIIRQNIAIALGLKAIFLVLAVLGIATLWMAIVADLGATLLVIFNAVRLLRREDDELQSADLHGGDGVQTIGAMDAAQAA